MEELHAAEPAWRPLQCAAVAALFAVALGIALQLGLLGLRVWGDVLPSAAKSLADFSSGVGWSTIVCSGVALGLGASRHRERLMGLLGLVCAPAAFACAKGIQRGVETMAGAEPSKLGLLTVEIGLVKTIEYALLALVLAWLIGKRRSTWLRHALVGLGFGLVGGSCVLALEMAHAASPLPPAKLLGIAVNEVLFPIGCSLVIYVVARLAGAAQAPDARNRAEAAELAIATD